MVCLEQLLGKTGESRRKSISSLLMMSSRDTSRGQAVQILEVHRALLWGRGRQSGLCSCSLKPPGNLSPRRSPGALLLCSVLHLATYSGLS